MLALLLLCVCFVFVIEKKTGNKRKRKSYANCIGQSSAKWNEITKKQNITFIFFFTTTRKRWHIALLQCACVCVSVSVFCACVKECVLPRNHPLSAGDWSIFSQLPGIPGQQTPTTPPPNMEMEMERNGPRHRPNQFCQSARNLVSFSTLDRPWPGRSFRYPTRPVACHFPECVESDVCRRAVCLLVSSSTLPPYLSNQLI